MDANATYHPEDASLYAGLSPADRYEVQQTLRHITLAEFLAKSGTTGIQGAAYLVAPKLYDLAVVKSMETDVVPRISAYMASQWPGDSLDVPINSDTAYRPTEYSSGGRIATATVSMAKATVKPIPFGVVVPIGEDMIEDCAYDIIQYHVERAALGFGDKASELALTVLKTATDGHGTVNSGASGNADETKWAGATTTDIEDMLAALSDDRWKANTLLITTEAWEHSVKTTGNTLTNLTEAGAFALPPVAEGFDMKIGTPPLDVLFSNNRALHTWATDTDTGGMTNCVTIVFDRNNALLTARKRWLQIENYAHPIEDLTNITITARQDSVTLFNDAIGVITET